MKLPSDLILVFKKEVRKFAKKFIMFIFLDANDFKEHLGQRFSTGGHLQIPKNL